MRVYERAEAIRQMNVRAGNGEPFVFLVDYLQQHILLESPAAIDPSEWLYELNGFGNGDTCKAVSSLPDEIVWRPLPEPFADYERSFRHVQANILAGNSFLANLTCMTPVETNLSLKDIYLHSDALYKVWLKDRFVFFSPEIFVRVEDGKISSYPMKGTIDVTLPDARQRLEEDLKEAAEHATIVDLIRNDLSMVAEQVHVSRYRYFDKIQTNKGPILQTSSEICGRLPGNYRERIGDILFAMLPAGSITGAPKRKTMEIIREAEGYERGFYTGIAGHFDGNRLDSAVMIRFVEQQEDRFFFKSGGGITCRSDVRSEYEEMIQKVYVPICRDDSAAGR